jgi:hypothetical protein
MPDQKLQLALELAAAVTQLPNREQSPHKEGVYLSPVLVGCGTHCYEKQVDVIIQMQVNSQ